MSEPPSTTSAGPPGLPGESGRPDSSGSTGPPRRPVGQLPEGASPATGASWGPTEILIGIGIVLVGLLVASVIFAIVDPGESRRTGTKLLLQAATGAIFVIAAVGVARSEGRLNPTRALGLGPSLARPVEWIGLRVPAPLAYGVAAFAAYFVFQLIFGSLVTTEQDDLLGNLGYGTSALVDVAIGLLVIVVAPVTEEIFFRGFMFAGIRSRAKFLAAALISSVFWGALHYTGGDTWTAVVVLSVFGVSLCWVYEKTGSIRTTIVIHAINNAIAFATLLS